jgi:hypothetical protein
MQRNGLRSARKLPEPARSQLMAIAKAEAASFEAYPVAIRGDVQTGVRDRLAADEQRRLGRLAGVARERPRTSNG